MKPLLWNTKGLRSKVKSPINKEEITFTCCQGPVLQKDWCSHIKSAPWKVLLKQHECQLYRWFFFSIMFHFRACSAVLLRYWYWDLFCVLVWSFKKKSVFVKIFFFLSSLRFPLHSHGVCCSLSVVCTIIQHAGLSSDRHWSKEMRNDLHSLAPLHFHLPYYYQTHTHTHTSMPVCAHACRTSFHRWLVKSPLLKDT